MLEQFPRAYRVACNPGQEVERTQCSARGVAYTQRLVLPRSEVMNNLCAHNDVPSRVLTDLSEAYRLRQCGK